MVTGVQEVVLLGGDGTLDMDTLAQYDGKGECGEVGLWWDTRERYRDQLKAWASNIGWHIEDGARGIKASRRARPGEEDESFSSLKILKFF